MCFNYSFLLTNFYKDDFIPDSFESSSVIVPVNKLLWKERAYYLQKLYDSATSFCFGFFQAHLGWENTELSQIRDSLSLYFFLPNYAKKMGAYLSVSDLVAGRDKEVMDAIERSLETQGIVPLSKNYTAENCHLNKFNPYYYYNTDLLEAFDNKSASNFSLLFKKLVAENGLNKQIIVTVEDENDFQRKLGFIKDFDQWIWDNEKVYADLLSVFKRTNEEYLKLKIDNKKLRFRLANYDDYLKAVRKIAQWHVDEYLRISREQQMAQQYGTSISANNPMNTIPMYYSSNEAIQKEMEYLKSNRDSILQWYQKEYEVLPLWYKRFGHILKVMMGKRSFKSLYK